MAAKSERTRSPYDLSAGDRLADLRSAKSGRTGGGANPYTGAKPSAAKSAPKANGKKRRGWRH